MLEALRTFVSRRLYMIEELQFESMEEIKKRRNIAAHKAVALQNKEKGLAMRLALAKGHRDASVSEALANSKARIGYQQKEQGLERL